MVMLKHFEQTGSDREYVLDAQRRGALLDGDEAGDVRVFARIGALVFGVLGEDFHALFCGLDVDRAVGLRQMVVHRQRPLAASLVFDGGNNIAISVEQVDGGQMGNSRQFFQVFSKRHR